jgi:hypothetical protein
MNHHIALDETGEIRDSGGQTVGYFVPASEYEKLQTYRQLFLAWARKEFPADEVKRLADELLHANLDDYCTFDELTAAITQAPSPGDGNHAGER